MGKRAQLRRAAKEAARSTPRVELPAELSFAVERMARSTCPECGSDHIRWAKVGAIAASDEPEAAYARELLPTVGPDASMWSCADCGNAGAFA